jgi:hypothetical protein
MTWQRPNPDPVTSTAHFLVRCYGMHVFEQNLAAAPNLI